MSRRLALLFAVWSAGASLAVGKPAQVILIRHAEKPDTGHELSLKGRERAAALVPYFLGNPDVLKYGAPAALYAQKSTKGHASRRPVQTVQGLADTLKLSIVSFAHEDFAAMVREISAKPAYDGKTVLICWEHKGIPDVVKAFGVKDGPSKWHGFDRTWIITFPKEGKPAFQDLPQKLMYGDSER